MYPSSKKDPKRKIRNDSSEHKSAVENPRKNDSALTMWTREDFTAMFMLT
jgi:hypothetical protein